MASEAPPIPSGCPKYVEEMLTMCFPKNPKERLSTKGNQPNILQFGHQNCSMYCKFSNLQTQICMNISRITNCISIINEPIFFIPEDATAKDMHPIFPGEQEFIPFSYLLNCTKEEARRHFVTAIENEQFQIASLLLDFQKVHVNDRTLKALQVKLPFTRHQNQDRQKLLNFY